VAATVALLAETPLSTIAQLTLAEGILPVIVFSTIVLPTMVELALLVNAPSTEIVPTAEI
jgi:hypothetical protein